MAVVSISDLQSRMSAVQLAQFGSDDETNISTLAQAQTALADATVISNINTVIADAEETLFAIIRGCVDVTDTDLFPAMRPMIAKVAIFYLHQRHRGQVPEYSYVENQQAMAWAYKVQSGTLKLERDPQVASSKVRSTDGPNTTSYSNFNDTSFRGWTQSGV